MDKIFIVAVAAAALYFYTRKKNITENDLDSEDNFEPITLTADKDDYFIMSDSLAFDLSKDKLYRLHLESTLPFRRGMLGGATDGFASDTVEVFLCKDGSLDNLENVIDFRAKTTGEESNVIDLTFQVPESGTYVIRFDVNKKGSTATFSNLEITDASPILD